MFVQTNTIKSIKEYFQSELKEHFTESEIKLISQEFIMARLKLSKSEFMLSNEDLLSESDLLYFRTAVKRLLNNEPFQYVLGSNLFYGLEIKCDSRALIPRPETEELVDWIVQTYQDKTVRYNMWDICTGSGCIALALQSVYKSSLIAASDLSDEALELAKENKRLLGLPVSLLKEDALDGGSLPFQTGSLDCIVSNPPYIPNQEKSEMNSNVLEYEPGMALFVENDQVLIFYKAIAAKAKLFLKKGGCLFLEIHELFANETKVLLEECGFSDVEIRKDMQGKERMIKALKN